MKGNPKVGRLLTLPVGCPTPRIVPQTIPERKHEMKKSGKPKNSLKKPLDIAALVETMERVVLPTDALTPYAKNPRINDGAVEAVANSIRRFGFASPIVVRGRDNEIINGHTRWKAAKSLGLEKVPCVRADHLTDAEARAFRIADNKTAELASWDENLLGGEIADLPDFDFADFGFDPPVVDGGEYGTDFQLADGDKSEICKITFTLHERQKETIEAALRQVGDCAETFGNTNKNGNALYEVARQWLANR